MKLTAAPVQHLLTVCTCTVARQLALTFAADQTLLLLHALLHLRGCNCIAAPSWRLEIVLVMLLKIFDQILMRFTVALLVILQVLRAESRELVVVGESNRSNVLGRRGLKHASGLVLLVAAALLLVHYID